MKKTLLILSLLIVSLTCRSQQAFENGYFINDSGRKIEGQIKLTKWRDNPSEFEYRRSENEDPQTMAIDSVLEFGIDNLSRYIRRTVLIDRSGENLNNLSSTRAPEFEEEQLFLKVLVEGKASLYLFSDGNLKRFFYNKNSSDIDQLVFKEFNASGGRILQNNEFRQQLWKELSCSAIEMKRIENLKYKRSSLVNLFIDYNRCHNSDFVQYEEKKKSDPFHLAVRPRVNYSSLSIEHDRVSTRNSDFGNKIGFGIGIELEYTLPFINRRWALFVEPTFQYFEGEKSSETSTVFGGIQVVNVNYKSIEFPVGLKHYFLLNESSNLFLTASYVIDYSPGSTIEYSRADGHVYNTIETEIAFNPAIGIGYRYEDYSLALRHQFNRDVLVNFLYYNANYQTTSLILGYTLF